jgi:hypothetical protein
MYFHFSFFLKEFYWFSFNQTISFYLKKNKVHILKTTWILDRRSFLSLNSLFHLPFLFNSINQKSFKFLIPSLKFHLKLHMNTRHMNSILIKKKRIWFEYMDIHVDFLNGTFFISSTQHFNMTRDGLRISVSYLNMFLRILFLPIYRSYMIYISNISYLCPYAHPDQITTVRLDAISMSLEFT